MIDVEQFRKFTADYHKNWRVLDETLYRLCRDHPNHCDRAQLNAKLWIIGRSYATGIERKIATKGSQGSSMTQLADHLFQHGEQVNQWVRELQLLKEPLTAEVPVTVVTNHMRFVRLLCPITRAGHSNASVEYRVGVFLIMLRQLWSMLRYNTLPDRIHQISCRRAIYPSMTVGFGYRSDGGSVTVVYPHLTQSTPSKSYHALQIGHFSVGAAPGGLLRGTSLSPTTGIGSTSC